MNELENEAFAKLLLEQYNEELMFFIDGLDQGLTIIEFNNELSTYYPYGNDASFSLQCTNFVACVKSVTLKSTNRQKAKKTGDAFLVKARKGAIEKYNLLKLD